jgi:outer membrane protein
MIRALALVFWITVGPGLAQEAPTTPYDLERVVATALEHHASLRASQAGVDAAQAQVRQVGAHFVPQVNAQGGFIWLEQQPSLTVPGFGMLAWGREDNYTANLKLDYPLYTGGKLEGMRAGARAGVAMAQEDLERQRQTVAVNAARAYYQALEAQRMIGVLQEQTRALEEALRAAHALYAQGVVAKIDVLRPDVALSGAQDALTQVQASYQTAVAAVVEAMGLPPGTAIELAETETQRTAPQAADEEWPRAWQRRPELRRLAAQTRAAEAQLKVARSAALPQVGLFAQSDFARSTAYPDTGVLSAGVMVQQSVLDGGAAREAVKEAKARLDQLQAAEEQLRYGIALEVEAAFNAITSAQARVDTTAHALELAREALRLAQVGYQNSVTSMPDLLSAQAALTKANADHESALSALRLAFAEFDYAMGRIVGQTADQPAPHEG